MTEKIVFYLMIAAVVATVVSLAMGLFHMVKGQQKENAQKANKMMWRRIWFQGAALAMFALMIVLSKGV